MRNGQDSIPFVRGKGPIRVNRYVCLIGAAVASRRAQGQIPTKVPFKMTTTPCVKRSKVL